METETDPDLKSESEIDSEPVRIANKTNDSEMRDETRIKETKNEPASEEIKNEAKIDSEISQEIGEQEMESKQPKSPESAIETKKELNFNAEITPAPEKLSNSEVAFFNGNNPLKIEHFTFLQNNGRSHKKLIVLNKHPTRETFGISKKSKPFTSVYVYVFFGFYHVKITRQHEYFISQKKKSALVVF